MRATELTLGIALLAAMLVTLPEPAKGEEDEPDLEVQASDLSFDPRSLVVVDTNVQIDADIHNVGNCYIGLSDLLDTVEYNHSFPAAAVIKIEARIRSSQGETVNVIASVEGGSSAVADISNPDWDIVEFSPPITVPVSGSSYMFVQRWFESGTTDLEIDRVRAYRQEGLDWVIESQDEAENYDSGGDDVDHIYPQQVAVDFYDGDPNSGGIQINGTQIVGDVQRTTESGTVWILRAGPVATATVTWTAEPVGRHDIYADIQPDSRETQTANNTAFSPILVFPELPGPRYPIMGNLQFHIGDGLPIPINGPILATAVVTQESTGPDPRRITIPNRVFHHPGTPAAVLPLFGANNNIWQILTQINLTLPTTPMRTGDVLLNVLQEGGRTGPATVAWCPGQPPPTVTYNPNCTTAGAGPITNIPGILRYRKTENQFGGPLSAQFGGLVDLALRLGAAPPPCNELTTTCQAWFAIGPPPQTGVIGGPFGRWTKTTQSPLQTGEFQIIATTQGIIIGITPTGYGPGRPNPASSWGGPWTTGSIQNTAITLGPAGSEIFTRAGFDKRVSGVGTISLIAGAVSNRGTSGPNANRGRLNITVPEPAAAVGATAAFLLLAACHILVRRRSR